MTKRPAMVVKNLNKCLQAQLMQAFEIYRLESFFLSVIDPLRRNRRDSHSNNLLEAPGAPKSTQRPAAVVKNLEMKPLSLICASFGQTDKAGYRVMCMQLKMIHVKKRLLKQLDRHSFGK